MALKIPAKTEIGPRTQELLKMMADRNNPHFFKDNMINSLRALHKNNDFLCLMEVLSFTDVASVNPPKEYVADYMKVFSQNEGYSKAFREIEQQYVKLVDDKPTFVVAGNHIALYLNDDEGSGSYINPVSSSEHFKKVGLATYILDFVQRVVCECAGKGKDEFNVEGNLSEWSSLYEEIYELYTPLPEDCYYHKPHDTEVKLIQFNDGDAVMVGGERDTSFKHYFYIEDMWMVEERINDFLNQYNCV